MKVNKTPYPIPRPQRRRARKWEALGRTSVQKQILAFNLEARRSLFFAVSSGSTVHSPRL